MRSQEIRRQYLAFFKEKSHKIVDSAPLVLKGDPTLMFTNAGMNQFKEYFLGQREVVDKRIVNTQKCLRVSGKHNDLEEVGKDTYHHTFFEMLGNWSFGDYFKKEAIEWAWELLVDRLKIDQESIYVSVFEGSKDDDNLEIDQETYDLWKEIVPEEKIIFGNKKNNFWEMGVQGPCGPCSEIHIDIRSAEEKAKISGRNLINTGHPKVVEIWNLVFVQFNRKADRTLEKLPSKHVDTGMGFERLCMVLQGVQSTYETDVFKPLIYKIEEITKSNYGKNKEIDIAIRVIADHLRAVAFSIADGQLPSSNGAGYVIRRILRRAIRYGFTFLNKKEPFIFKLIEVLNEQMGEYFPEIKTQYQLILNVIKEEETSFLRTLGQGLNMLDKIIKGTKGDKISGSKAFELYDTFGFPIDLTSLILKEKGFKLDNIAFKKELNNQKKRSKVAAESNTGDWTVLVKEDTGEFVGYDTLEEDIKIIRYREIFSKKSGVQYQIVFNKTPFYPEGGGQVGDNGYFTDGVDKISILDTKRENNLVLHFARNLPKKIDVNFKAIVDSKSRNLTQCNHSATHLLHQALKYVIGDHVEQKGSLVNSKNLRFDFSHFSKVTDEELKQVEKFVNNKIQEAISVKEYRNIPIKKAIEKGAIALFGEKYGDEVRMIQFGNSLELCGGTHVENTQQIWCFKIVAESSVAAGIRRIEAITSDSLKTYFEKQDSLVYEVKKNLKNNTDPLKAIIFLQDENKALKKQMESIVKEKLKSEIKSKNGINYIVTHIQYNVDFLEDIAYKLGNEYKKLFFFVGTEFKGKARLICYISKNLVEEKNLDAVKIVRQLARHIRGGGGGQKFFATAGGVNTEGISESVSKAKEEISKIILKCEE